MEVRESLMKKKAEKSANQNANILRVEKLQGTPHDKRCQRRICKRSNQTKETKTKMYIKFLTLNSRANRNTLCHDIDCFLATTFIYGGAKKPNEKSKEDEQTFAELSSAHRRSQAKNN